MPFSTQLVLVTGGAGFIGSHLVDRLILENPKNIVIVDNFVLGNERNLVDGRRSAIDLASRLARCDSPRAWQRPANVFTTTAAS